MLPIFENTIVEEDSKRNRDWAHASMIARLRREERAKKCASAAEALHASNGPFEQNVPVQTSQETAKTTPEPMPERSAFEWRRADFDLLP